MLFDYFCDPLVKKLESDGNSEGFPKPFKKINQYLIVKKLGEGSFAKVYLAIDQNTGALYSIKRFRIRELQKVDNGLSQLRREICNMRYLEHPNIIRIHEVLHNEESDTVYLVLDYADCGSLAKIIENSAPLPLEAVKSIFMQILTALEFIHTHGVIHQDVKPSNILICSDGRAILSDFGVGHSFQSTEKVVGTPVFQAVDFLADDPSFKFSSSPEKEDVWSLGISLFQTIFLFLPYEGNSFYEIAQKIRRTPLVIPSDASPECESLLRGVLAVNPSERFTIRQVMDHPFFRDCPKATPFNFPVDEVPSISKDYPIISIDATVFNDNALFSRPSLSFQEILRSPEDNATNIAMLDRVPIAGQSLYCVF